MEFPITTISEKAINNAAHIGFKYPRQAIGIAIILDIFGIQIGPLVAGLGLFSVAVALGAQDFFKNLIGLRTNLFILCRDFLYLSFLIFLFLHSALT